MCCLLWILFGPDDDDDDDNDDEDTEHKDGGGGDNNNHNYEHLHEIPTVSPPTPVAYPGVRDNRSTINTKTGYDDDMMMIHKHKIKIESKIEGTL